MRTTLMAIIRNRANETNHKITRAAAEISKNRIILKCLTGRPSK